MREQIITQISLGIVSGDLKAGEKLPSTRELARRFQIHQNTISNAYRELAERSLVEFKKGSGVYVRGKVAVEIGTLDQLINRFFQDAAALGFNLDEIKTRLESRLETPPAKHFLVVESDAELRKILIAEIVGAANAKVDGMSFEEFAKSDVENETRINLIYDKTNDAHQSLPPHKNCIYLKVNSVSDSMTDKRRPPETDLIAVVSRWETFLELAKMYLLAARVQPETLVLRPANEPDWKNGLSAVSLIICDSATAKEFPADKRIRVFRLIADSSLSELRELIG